MAEMIIMPKLGFNMNEGKIIQWYKKENEEVSKGEPLFEIETDKTAIDIEATHDGIVRKLFAAEGDILPVTLPIAIIGKKDENIDALVAQAESQLCGSAWAPESVTAAEKEPAEPTGGQDYDFDVIVIGGGPGGYVAAIKAAQMGKKTAIIEKEAMGGTCLNAGCIPTKALLKSVETLKEIKKAGEYGIEGIDSSTAVLNLQKVQNRKNSIVRELVGGVDGLLRKNGVTVFRGTGELTGSNTVNVNGKNYTSANIIIATGSKVKKLPVKIDPKMNFSTSRELLELEEIPETSVIIGGGVIGVEFAYYLASLGCKVTIIEFLDSILAMLDTDICNAVSEKLIKLGIDIITGARVTEVTADSVVYEKNGESSEIMTSHVLMAVGRAPHLEGIDTEKLGIATDRGAIATDGCCRTTIQNIYAIGDVNGKSMLAHTASMEGITAVESLCGHKREMDYGKVPGVVFIKPEIAWVGMTETEAKAKYPEIKTGTFPLMANGKSKIEGDDSGFIKVIIEPSYNEILGVHIFGIHASDLIAEGTAAMVMEGTADEIINTIHPHPTISESIHEAFHSAVDKAIHF